jgi:death-on-curing protein
MIRYITLEEVLESHRWALEQCGGLPGVRVLGGLESALAQPQMAFGGQEKVVTQSICSNNYELQHAR